MYEDIKEIPNKDGIIEYHVDGFIFKTRKEAEGHSRKKNLKPTIKPLTQEEKDIINSLAAQADTNKDLSL